MTKPSEVKPAFRAARHLISAALLAAGLVAASSAHASITFVFDYTAHNGKTAFIGTDQLFVDRRQALETAGTLFSNYFGSVFTNSGTITMNVEGVVEDCSAGCGLAYAGGAGVLNSPGFGNGEVIRRKLVDGIDLNGSAADGVVGVNWGANWELNPSISVQQQNTGNFDFYSALFHEFTHALGFSTKLQEDGSDATEQGSLKGGRDYPGYWLAFDKFKTNCGNFSLIDGNSFETNQGIYDFAKTNAMCFNGPNAMAANGGNQVALFAPSTYLNGSTGSHLDKAVFTTDMMKHDRAPNVDEARTFSAVETGVLMDIGYTVTAVPEPATIALMLGGLGVVVARSRKARGKAGV